MTVEFQLTGKREEKAEIGYVHWKECTKRQRKMNELVFQRNGRLQYRTESTLTVYEAK